MKKVFLLLVMAIMFALPSMVAQNPEGPTDREEGTTTCTTEVGVYFVMGIPIPYWYEACTSEV